MTRQGNRHKGECTSVTPKRRTAILSPAIRPSSASICWKQIFSVAGSNTPRGGRSHCWSFSALFCLRSLISWVIFSRTSSSNVLFWGCVEPNPFRKGFCVDVLSPPDSLSSLRFFIALGDVRALRSLLVASPRTRFWGMIASGIMTTQGV